MIVSVHLAEPGARRALAALRGKPDPAELPGCTYAESVLTAPLGANLLPAVRPRRVGLIAAWEEEGALEGFLLGHPLAEPLAGGWHVRMQPLRVSGAWPAMPGLPTDEIAVKDEEPVAVLTLGRLRLHRALPFLRTSAAAEAQALGDPTLLMSTGLARPPHLVSTFSLWRSAAGMRAYAYGKTGAEHHAAIEAHRQRPFHHESAFVRLRPYASEGAWEGGDPLAGSAPAISYPA